MAAPYSWLPKVKDHNGGSSNKTGTRRNQFYVNPEWVSEDNFPMNPMGLRRFRPWAYEYQGARHFPWGSVENRWSQEHADRIAMEAQQATPGERRSFTDYEREMQSARVPLYVQSTRPTWNRNERSATSGAEYNKIFSRHCIDDATTKPRPAPKSSFNHEVKEKMDRTHMYDPIVYVGPNDEQLRTRSMMISKCATYQPRDGRPRFDRPYMNFANSMWMKYPQDPVVF